MRIHRFRQAWLGVMVVGMALGASGQAWAGGFFLVENAKAQERYVKKHGQLLQNRLNFGRLKGIKRALTLTPKGPRLSESDKSSARPGEHEYKVTHTNITIPRGLRRSTLETMKKMGGSVGVEITPMIERRLLSQKSRGFLPTEVMLRLSGEAITVRELKRIIEDHLGNKTLEEGADKRRESRGKRSVPKLVERARLAMRKLRRLVTGEEAKEPTVVAESDGSSEHGERSTKTRQVATEKAKSESASEDTRETASREPPPKVAVQFDWGARQYMEDRAIHFEVGGQDVLVVADGAGGESRKIEGIRTMIDPVNGQEVTLPEDATNAGWAAYVLTQSVMNYAKSKLGENQQMSTAEVLERAFAIAQQTVSQHGLEGVATLTVAVVDRPDAQGIRNVTLAGVGDTPAYRVTRDSAQLLNKLHEDPYTGRLYRIMGGHDAKPDVTTSRLRPGESLYVASDGVEAMGWPNEDKRRTALKQQNLPSNKHGEQLLAIKKKTQQEVAAKLHQIIEANGHRPDKAVKALVSKAKKGGGTEADNISVVGLHNAVSEPKPVYQSGVTHVDSQILAAAKHEASSGGGSNQPVKPFEDMFVPHEQLAPGLSASTH